MFTTSMMEETATIVAQAAEELGITQRQLVAEALLAVGMDVHPDDLKSQPLCRSPA